MYSCGKVVETVEYYEKLEDIPAGDLRNTVAELVEKLKTQVTCPFSVMGGIKAHHLETLVSKGFRHIAMVTEITQAVNVREKVEELCRIMRGAGK